MASFKTEKFVSEPSKFELPVALPAVVRIENGAVTDFAMMRTCEYFATAPFERRRNELRRPR
jgi:hypothetical protein